MIHHFKLRHLATAMLAGAVITATASAGQAFDAASATALAEKHRDAIVEVHLVFHMSIKLIEGPDGLAEMFAQAPAEEQEMKARGVTIHPSGLVGVPGLLLDPTMFMSEISIPTPLGDLKLGLESALANVRIITADGTEFPAEVVLADRDHGLMLVKPLETQETPRPALVSDAAQAHPPAFTEVLCLGRLPAAFGHQPTATVIRTTGPLAARHGLDPLAEADQGALGCAVVDAEGTFLGITAIPMSADKINPAMHDLGLYVIPASSLHRLAEAHTK